MKDVLGGLDQCGKGAARCRMLAAIAAMRAHGTAFVAPTVVSALLSYAHSQHAPVHVGELCRLADQATAAVVQKLVERLMASMAIMTGDEDRGLAASERALTEQLLGPVLRVACKGPKKASMAMAAAMLEQMVACCKGYAHVKQVSGAARVVLDQMLTMLSPGSLESAVPEIFLPLQRCVDLLSIALDPSAVRRLVALCAKGAESQAWQFRHQAAVTLERLAKSVQMADPLFPGEGRLVVTPALKAVAKAAPAILAAIEPMRYDKAPAARAAAAAAASALSTIPGAAAAPAAPPPPAALPLPSALNSSSLAERMAARREAVRPLDRAPPRARHTTATYRGSSGGGGWDAGAASGGGWGAAAAAAAADAAAPGSSRGWQPGPGSGGGGAAAAAARRSSGDTQHTPWRAGRPARARSASGSPAVSGGGGGGGGAVLHRPASQRRRWQPPDPTDRLGDSWGASAFEQLAAARDARRSCSAARASAARDSAVGQQPWHGPGFQQYPRTSSTSPARGGGGGSGGGGAHGGRERARASVYASEDDPAPRQRGFLRYDHARVALEPHQPLHLDHVEPTWSRPPPLPDGARNFGVLVFAKPPPPPPQPAHTEARGGGNALGRVVEERGEQLLRESGALDEGGEEQEEEEGHRSEAEQRGSGGGHWLKATPSRLPSPPPARPHPQPRARSPSPATLAAAARSGGGSERTVTATLHVPFDALAVPGVHLHFHPLQAARAGAASAPTSPPAHAARASASPLAARDRPSLSPSSSPVRGGGGGAREHATFSFSAAQREHGRSASPQAEQRPAATSPPGQRWRSASPPGARDSGGSGGRARAVVVRAPYADSPLAPRMMSSGGGGSSGFLVGEDGCGGGSNFFFGEDGGGGGGSGGDGSFVGEGAAGPGDDDWQVHLYVPSPSGVELKGAGGSWGGRRGSAGAAPAAHVQPLFAAQRSDGWGGMGSRSPSPACPSPGDPSSSRHPLPRSPSPPVRASGSPRSPYARGAGLATLHSPRAASPYHDNAANTRGARTRSRSHSPDRYQHARDGYVRGAGLATLHSHSPPAASPHDYDAAAIRGARSRSLSPDRYQHTASASRDPSPTRAAGRPSSVRRSSSPGSPPPYPWGYSSDPPWATDPDERPFPPRPAGEGEVWHAQRFPSPDRAAVAPGWGGMGMGGSPGGGAGARGASPGRGGRSSRHAAASASGAADDAPAAGLPSFPLPERPAANVRSPSPGRDCHMQRSSNHATQSPERDGRRVHRTSNRPIVAVSAGGLGMGGGGGSGGMVGGRWPGAPGARAGAALRPGVHRARPNSGSSQNHGAGAVVYAASGRADGSRDDGYDKAPAPPSAAKVARARAFSGRRDAQHDAWLARLAVWHADATVTQRELQARAEAEGRARARRLMDEARDEVGGLGWTEADWG
ncbi:hypothetical protein FOA52_011202 [Chlamydomonas sp. UWO 241]|nr:hypothetical protein FOA52_011202 [Chlamydomonas sp. UWO 241]